MITFEVSIDAYQEWHRSHRFGGRKQLALCGQTRRLAFVDVGEFDRQVRRLVELGYPALAGLSGRGFVDLVEPLRAAAPETEPTEQGRAPFVLVVTRTLVPVEQMMAMTTLAGKTKPGFVNRVFEHIPIERFVATGKVKLPDERAYLLLDVDRGEEFRGVVPDEAMEIIAQRGRTPLTMEEGIAFVTHHPSALARNRCFSLAGSRSGDRRVPAIWISQGAPTLGWCWAGNPHTWLGMASAADRAA